MAHHGTHALPSRKAFAKTVDIFLYTAFGIRFGPACFPIGSASIVSYCVQAFLLCDRLFQPFPPFQDLDLPPAFLRFTVGEDASYYRLYTSTPSIICILSVGMSSPHMSYHIMHIHMPLRPSAPIGNRTRVLRPNVQPPLPLDHHAQFCFASLQPNICGTVITTHF